uniref:Bromodomain adjacent to zinc finger domain 2A n=1 Tax=Nothoprocta perdicaria TaxID=30464 RepID=A0A8C6YJQ1_NOTPE
METNNHFSFPGLPSAPAASGLKPAPSSGDGLYAKGPPADLPPQGKSLNGGVNVNGFSTVSRTGPSGSCAASPPRSGTPPLPAYDCLWDYAQYRPAGGLKERGAAAAHLPGLAQYPLNGAGAASRPASPGHNTNLRGAGQEFWGNGPPSSMGLNFDSQELYDSFPEQNFELLQNGPAAFYGASQPSPMLSSGVQPFALPRGPQDEAGAGQEAAREASASVSESGAGLVGSLELEDAQPELKICSYDGSAAAVVPLGQEAAVLAPGAAGGCLGAASPMAAPLQDTHILSQDPLEPFESLDRDPGTGALYEMDDSQLVSGTSPLEEPPDMSSLQCSASSSLHDSGSFGLLADDSQAAASLFGSASPPPVLGEAVLQDSSLDLNSSTRGGQEESESLELDAPLEPESPALSPDEEEEEEDDDDDEEAGDSPETSAALEGESEEAAPAGASAGGERGAAPRPRGSLGARGAQRVSALSAGDVPRRRIATQEEVRFPLQHGWRREVRIKKGNHRWQGETWYYGPCGKRMKQFPEVIKYLSRNVVQDVRREHFSFSPRMPVGDFYEERDTPEGVQWVKLSPEEIPSRIQAITGKRGRPRNAEKGKGKEAPAVKRGRGRPPKLKLLDLLSKTDARLLKRLEAQGSLLPGPSCPARGLWPVVCPRGQAKNKQKQEAKAPKAKEAKKKSKKGKAEKGKEKVRPKEKKGKAARKVDKSLLAQRRLEERRRQQLILEEMKKPTEDMCLGDHQPLPALARIPGLVLPAGAFSHCLTVVEFLRSYGKVLGFDPAKDVPSLCALQEGLLGMGARAGDVQDLLVRLLQAALYDPGLPPYCQSLKILGEKVSEISLNRDTVSEILRCFLMAYGAEDGLCDGLRTKPFQALPPDKKAAILAFLVNELNSSALIINEIDKTLENMSNYRKNKWIIEGRLRRLKIALAKKTGRPESEITGLDDGRRRRSSRLTEENGLELEEEEESRGRKSRRDEEVPRRREPAARLAAFPPESHHRCPLTSLSPRCQADTSASSVPELERQIEKLAKVRGWRRGARRPAWHRHLSCPSRHRALPTEADVLPQEAAPFIADAAGGLLGPGPVPAAVLGPAPPGRHLRGGYGSKEEPPQQCEPKPPPVNGVLEDAVPLAQSQHDLSQSAFLSWLSQTQSSLLRGSVLTPDSSPGTGAAALPPAEALPDAARGPSQPHGQPRGEQPGTAARQVPRPVSSQLNGLPAADPSSPLLASTPVHAGARAHGACPRSRSSLEKLQEPPAQPKRRGRPPTKFFKQIEQKYLTQLTEQPVPPEMQSGWWWLQAPEELEAVARALHPRGIREKALHKHLAKHKDFLPLAQWSVMERAYEADLSVLQWVEELEQRVLTADLQIRGWTCPSPDSARSDLQYCEHKVEPLEDITIRNRREGPPVRREPTNPLDLAVLRLAALEQNVERRYLKEPLWPLHEVVLEKAVLSSPGTPGTTEIAYEITPRVRAWRQTLERCRSAAQVSLCIYQLERSIAWEKSVNKVTCLVCRRGDDDEHLLLCDGCDRGCHLYCHRPKMTEVPEGDWFCSVCLAQVGRRALASPAGPPGRLRP